MSHLHRRARQSEPIFDQINLAPLLDLTFLLLIVFMITMPLMEYGTAIKPPSMNSNRLPEDNFKSVTLAKDGKIMIDKNTFTKDELLAELRRLKGQNPKMELLLRADGASSYKDVIELMAYIRRGGFQEITLVTQAEKK